MEERLRILLCEDDENLGMLLREYLQAKGYAADLFSDGESGYKAFLKGKYDLCVLDVMMPKKDGFTLAQEIRTVNSEVPIIFLTAKSLKEDILEGFKIGADDYITKPFSMEELVFRIEAILRNRFSPSTTRAPNSPPRSRSCSASCALTSTRFSSGTSPSRPSGSTTTTSTHEAWMFTSPNCVNTSKTIPRSKSSTSTARATNSLPPM